MFYDILSLLGEKGLNFYKQINPPFKKGSTDRFCCIHNLQLKEGRGPKFCDINITLAGKETLGLFGHTLDTPIME